MKKILLLSALIISALSVNAQQWQKNGSKIYYNDGKVGIGTNNPSTKLHVIAPEKQWKARFSGPDGIGSIQIGPVNGDWAHIYTDRPSFIFNKDIYAISGGFSAYSNSNLYLKTHGTVRMTIKKTNGFVGIGTTEPESKLDIRGDLYINSGDNHIYWRKHYMTMGTKPGDYTHNVLRLKPGGASNGYLNSTLEMYKANSETDHELRIKLRANGVSYFNGGSVGIGTESPTKKLDVHGDINFTGNLYKNGELFEVDGSSSSSSWTQNGSNTYYKNGNVGIGTSSADAKLSIKNTGYDQNSIYMDNLNSDLYFGDHLLSLSSKPSWDYVPYIQWEAPNGKRQAYLGWKPEYFNLTLENGYDFSINGGKVGIGTTKPVSKLEIISTDSHLARFYYNDNAAGATRPRVDIYGMPNKINFRTTYNTGGAALSFGTHSVNDAIYIAENGEVGIGTTKPVSKLEVNGDIALARSHKIKFLETVNGGDRAYIRSTNGEKGDYNSLIFAVGGGDELMKLHYTGRVGIGTTDPSAIFEVNKCTNDYWTSRIRNCGGEGKGLLIQSGYGGSTSNFSGIIMKLEDGSNNPRMTVYSNGNIGIGTTKPSEKLTVKGTILASKVKIVNDNEIPASDYVFEPDYRLRSLEEVEKYVKTNKHLPEVPSAKEFKENGYSVGQMDDLLLRKVEELTLYIIEQDKKTKKLKSEAGSWKAEVKALKVQNEGLVELLKTQQTAIEALKKEVKELKTSH